MGEFFQVGAAETNITPAPGLPMDGYVARQGPSTGTHDPLMAQVLVLGIEEARAALVTLDALAVSASFADPLRARLAALLGTTPDAVMVCPSHTHCGPAGLQDWFPAGAAPALDPTLTAMVGGRILAAAEEALRRLAPARLVYGATEVTGIGGDRNQPGRVPERRVTALRFDRPDGSPTALLFHYACHPTVLGPQTREYSADFPGAARERLRATWPGTVCLYLNGAAGNISPRYFRREQSFAEARRLGGLLAEGVVAALARPQRAAARLSWRCQAVELPVRTFPTDAALPEPPAGSDRQAQVRAEGIALQAQLSRFLGGRTTQRAGLCALRIGPWALVGVPGEPFRELAVAVRQRAPQALIVGYANDYVGYFPTQAAIEARTYEALSSPYDARAQAILQERIVRLLGEDW